jgi:hypothetical protein
MKRALIGASVGMLASVIGFASAAASPSADGCADDLLSDMVSRAAEGANTGHCDRDGNFAVAAVVVEGDGPQAYEKARVAAVRAIAETFGLRISGETVSEDSSAEKNGATSFSSFFSSKTTASVREKLAGVASRGVVDAGSKRLALFAMTQRDIERQGDLHRTIIMKTDGPATVQATGLAMVRDSRADVAQQAAVNSAKRQAVEMVMGAMMIGQTNVSTSSTDDKERFGSYVFSNSAGFIDSYRVIEERQDAAIYTVRIEATIIPKKLFDSYREHLQSIGDPVFGIDAHGDSKLLSTLTEYFHDKGLKIQDRVDGSDYLIDAKMKYTPVKDPGDVTGGRTGVRGELSWSIVNSATRESMSQLQTDGRSTCFVGSDTERQMDLVLEQIMRKKGPDMHKKLQSFVADLVAGRTLRVTFASCPDLAEGDVRDKFLAILRLHPQVRDIKPLWKSPDLILELKVVGRTDQLGGEIARMISEAGGPSGVSLTGESPTGIEFGHR